MCLIIWLFTCWHGGASLPTSERSFKSFIQGSCQKLEPTSCLGWSGLPPPAVPGGPTLVLPSGLWSFRFPHFLITEKWLFLGKGMFFKGCPFLLQRELGDSKHSRALTLTPPICTFASAFILIWGSSTKLPRRHLLVNSVPSFPELVPIILTPCLRFSSVNAFISQRSLGPRLDCPVPFLPELEESEVVTLDPWRSSTFSSLRLYLTLVIY